MRRGCCCQGGSQQEGNSECVPLCTGTHVYNFSFALSHAGWSRGTPGVETEFEQPAACAGECCGGRYMEVRKRENVVGKYTGRYHADGIGDPTDLCKCCKIESSNIVTPGGNWSADFQYTYATNAWVVNNYVEDFNYTNSLVATFFPCREHPYTSFANCQCPGPAGLFDVIRIVAAGANLVDFAANDGTGPCGLNSTSQWYANHTATLYYIKPVPFAACRTLAGTYVLACARYTVPDTPWLASSLGTVGGNCGVQAPPLCAYRRFVNAGSNCWIEDCGDCWTNDPIYSCASDAGFTVPRTITVA